MKIQCIDNKSNDLDFVKVGEIFNIKKRIRNGRYIYDYIENEKSYAVIWIISISKTHLYLYRKEEYYESRFRN